jgi:scyllo-inositol 2-dehydrogenase (NADP+)
MRATGGDDPIRVAVIGFGLGGAVFHAPLVSSTPGMFVASIVTSDPERQARAAATYPDARILPSADAVWNRAEDHELVVVTTPNRTHVPLGLAALEAGLPVVMDKPLAASSADGRRLVEAARGRDLLFTVFQNRRWDGDFLTIRRLLASGAFGEVVRFESRFERWRPEVDAAAWRELGEPADAGGLLFDLGAHLLDQAVQLFGPPTGVYAEVDRRRADAGVDDDVFVALTHPGGVRSHHWMTVLAPILGPRFRVLGTRGSFEKSGLDIEEDQLASGLRPGDQGWAHEPASMWGRFSSSDEPTPVETEAGGWAEFYAGVAASLRTGSPPPVDPKDAVLVLELIEAAIESSRTGRVIARA